MYFAANLSQNGVSIEFTKLENDKLSVRLLDPNDFAYGDFRTYDTNNIKQQLIEFGCSEQEIDKFLLFHKYEAFNEDNLNFRLDENKINQANETLNNLLYKKSNKQLDMIDKFILTRQTKDTIGKYAYDILPDAIKSAYKHSRTLNSDKDNIIFILNFIINHTESIIKINFKASLEKKYKDIGIYSINIDINPCDNEFYVNINKTLKLNDYAELNINAVRLSDLDPNLESFPEGIYTSNLKYDLLHNIKDNTITKYQHVQSIVRQYELNKLKDKAKYELIYTGVNPLSDAQIKDLSEPKTIITDSKDSPENYVFDKPIYTLDALYKSILSNTSPKLVSIKDLLLLIEIFA